MDYSTHARGKPKVTKPAIERVKSGPKSHQKVPEPSLESMKTYAPLIGQKCKQTRPKERGSPLSDLGPQNYMPTTENPLDFSG